MAERPMSTIRLTPEQQQLAERATGRQPKEQPPPLWAEELEPRITPGGRIGGVIGSST